MSNVYQFPAPDDAAGAACEWLARLERGMTEDEDRALHEWLDGSPARIEALVEAAALWDRMDTLSRLADLFPKPAPRRPWQSPWVAAMAASLLVAVAAGLFFVSRSTVEPPAVPAAAAWSVRAGQPEWQAYRANFQTDIGERSTIHLPDGSELMLNTNSRASVDFGNGARQIRLEQGELFIRVAHDTEHPLSVQAGNRIVRAVGTEFGVEIDADRRVEVIVTQGKVVIGVKPAASVAAANEPPSDSATPLAAGQRILLDDAEQVVREVSSDEISVRLSWRDGKIIFHGEPLASALSEIERYTPVEFIIQDEQLKTIRVAGLFKAGDVEGLLETLQKNFNISYERTGPDQIVLKAR